MKNGHAWRHVFMACSKREAMAIYVLKQACDNDIMPSVYIKGCVQTFGNSHFLNAQPI